MQRSLIISISLFISGLAILGQQQPSPVPRVADERYRRLCRKVRYLVFGGLRASGGRFDRDARDGRHVYEPVVERDARLLEDL